MKSPIRICFRDLLIVTFCLAAVSLQAQAAESCKSLFHLEIETLAPARVKKQAAANYQSDAVEAFQIIKALRIPAGSGLAKPLIAVLNDEALSSFHITLKEIALKLQANPAISTMTKEQFLDAVAAATETELSKVMSPQAARERAQLLRTPNLDKATFMRAIGQMTKEESLAALVGPQGIRDVSADSLVGRYLAKAQAAGARPSVLVSQFSKGPGYDGRGGEKLFISVDPQTLAAANEIFNGNRQLFLHQHTPGQGTLHMLFNGQDANYSSLTGPAQLTQQATTITPIVVLSSLEASNTLNYFRLGTLNKGFAKYPWNFKSVEADGSTTNYCRIGGYGSCTHWIGEMPIGEKFVTHYSFPGKVGDDPYGHGDAGGDTDNSSAVRTAPVGKYNQFRSTTATPIGQTTRNERLARIVWTHNLGREQLWSLVGDTNAEGLSKGEWANPGWVLYNFLTRSTEDRVPVVLVMRNNASAPLTQADLDALKTSITPR